MKLRSSLLLSLTALVAFAFGGTTAYAGNNDKKIDICHRTNSASNPWVLINVSTSAKQAHYDHGDPVTFELIGKNKCNGSTPPPPVDPPTVTVTLGPPVIRVGEKTTITWSSPAATSCLFGDGTTSGSVLSAAYAEDGTYDIGVICSNAGGDGYGIATLTVLPPAPSVYLTINGVDAALTITVGTPAQLSWNYANVQNCTRAITGDTGTGSANLGSLAVGTYLYSISCTGLDGSIVGDSVQLTVGTAPITGTVDVCLEGKLGGGSTGAWMVEYHLGTGAFEGESVTDGSDIWGNVAPALGVTFANGLYSSGSTINLTAADGVTAHSSLGFVSNGSGPGLVGVSFFKVDVLQGVTSKGSETITLSDICMTGPI